MSTGHTLPFVGRQQQLGLLTSLLEAATNGHPRVAIVTGEAGIGKTRLIQTFIGSLGQGVLVAQGGCHASGESYPYQPFVEALRPILRNYPDLPSHPASLLARLTDPDADPPGREDGEPSRMRTFDALLEVFAELDSSVVLILDDMQWASRSSLDLLTYLVRNLRREPVLVVVICRDHSKEPIDRILIETRLSSAAAVIPVASLTGSEFSEMMKYALGRPPTLPEVAQLVQLTGGITFYAEQVLLSDRDPKSLPLGVRASLDNVLDALPAQAHRACELLSVGGGELPGGVLEAALGGVDAAASLTAARDAAVVTTDPDGYQLRHSLYGEALLARLMPAQVRQLHKDLAIAAESLGFRSPGGLAAAEVARHWRQAGEVERAVPALRHAAKSAQRAMAFEEAHKYWSDVVDLLERRAEEFDVQLIEALVGAAESARWTGEPAAAADLISKALSRTTADDRMSRIRLHRLRATYRKLLGASDEATWDAERAFSLLDPDDPNRLRAEVQAELGRLVLLRGDVTRGRSLTEDALRCARRAGDPALESRILATLGPAQSLVDDFEGAISSLQEARQLAATYGDFDDQIRSINNSSFVLLDQERLLDGLAAATEAIELARRVGVTGSSGAASTAQDNALVALVGLSRWPEAHRRFDDLLAVRTNDVVGRGWRLAYRAQLLALMGRFDEASVDLTELDAMSLSSRPVLVGRATAFAELALWRHQPDAAIDVVEPLLTEDVPPAERAYLLSWCFRALGDQADVAWLARSSVGPEPADRARVLMARFGGEGLGRAGSPVATSLLRAEFARALGAPDVALWREVINRTVERPFDHAYAQYRVAGAWLASDTQDQKEVVAALAASRKTADGLRARPLVNAIDALIVRGNLEVRAEPVAARIVGPYQVNLTRREREVLTQLKLGMTNRKIGRALSITEKTASVHVSNVLGKLGVANRTAAAAVAHQLGL